MEKQSEFSMHVKRVSNLVAITIMVLAFLFSVIIPAQLSSAEETAGKVTEVLEDESFRYQSVGRTDPFESRLQGETKVQVDVKADPSKVQILGIVIDDEKGSRAMIKVPGGETFVVGKGTTIGDKRKGEVTKVTPEGIRFVETYIDVTGKEVVKEMLISARSDKER